MTTQELTAEIQRLSHNGYRTYQDWLRERNAEHSEAQWSAWMASGFWMLAPTLEELEAELNEELSRQEALAEYPAYLERKRIQAEQDECQHDEHDHGICLSCGKDIFDDLVAAAEFRADCMEDR